jgi:hypothetical protein
VEATKVRYVRRGVSIATRKEDAGAAVWTMAADADVAGAGGDEAGERP